MITTKTPLSRSEQNGLPRDSKEALSLLHSKVSREWRLDTFKDQGKEMYKWDEGCQDVLQFYSSGDFDGDGALDFAIGARKSLNPEESRIFILWGPLFNKYEVISNSRPFRIVKPGIIRSPYEDKELNMRNDGVEMHVCEASSWVMYWNGKQFQGFTISD